MVGWLLVARAAEVGAALSSFLPGPTASVEAGGSELIVVEVWVVIPPFLPRPKGSGSASIALAPAVRLLAL